MLCAAVALVFVARERILNMGLWHVVPRPRPVPLAAPLRRQPAVARIALRSNPGQDTPAGARPARAPAVRPVSYARRGGFHVSVRGEANHILHLGK